MVEIVHLGRTPRRVEVVVLLETMDPLQAVVVPVVVVLVQVLLAVSLVGRAYPAKVMLVEQELPPIKEARPKVAVVVVAVVQE